MKKNSKITALVPSSHSENGFPGTLPVFTAMGVPVFPQNNLGMTVAGREIKIGEVAQAKYNSFALLVCRKASPEQGGRHPGKQEFYTMGTLVKIVRADRESMDSLKVICQAICRARLSNMRNERGIIIAEAEYPEDIMPNGLYEQQEMMCLTMELTHNIREISEKYTSISPDELRRIMETLDTTDKSGILSDIAASMLHNASPEELQAVLETLNVRERMEKILFLYRREAAQSALKSKIMDRITKRIDRNQRVFMLHEMLREVKKELGSDTDSAEDDIDKFTAKLEEIRPFLSAEAEQRIIEELDKLKTTNRQSPDYTVSKNYLSWLTDIPWNKTTTDQLNVNAARTVLNRDHYGLDDVKKRILEFIGVAKMKGTVDGSIICLIGPPGVGKTSLGRSVAESLGRKFFRFSLGGMRDEAEIKGHRRTYIGAQPGKILSALKVTGTKNPVIMLDEIDKLGASYQGDPASALLEVLDPEQNCTFRDHFLDIPFDLSQVLFIATANVRDTIPGPLLDRMEIISLSGYIEEEKLAIAKRHLIPKLLPRNGLTKNDIVFSDSAIRGIIQGYARDSGVRSLENSIGSCMRKVAVRLAEKEGAYHPKTKISPSNLEEYLGKPVFYDDPLVKSPKPGVAMGLAWTSMGGSTLYIEVLPIVGEPGLKITGQLGDVMKESIQIAISLVERYADDYAIPEDFFKNHKIHIHVPAGATPKDGPSAGITIASAIISGAGNRALPPGWAMTGELTLTARVLPVGGIKEKMIAARRAGVKNVILPMDNKKDFTEINEQVREGLTAHYVSDYAQVYELLFKTAGNV